MNMPSSHYSSPNTHTFYIGTIPATIKTTTNQLGYRRILVRPFFLPINGKATELPSQQQLDALLEEPNTLSSLHEGIFHLHPHNVEATKAEMTKGMRGLQT